jgi:hypothetical protein
VQAIIPRNFADKKGKSNAKDLAQDFRSNILGTYTLLRNFLELDEVIAKDYTAA